MLADGKTTLVSKVLIKGDDETPMSLRPGEYLGIRLSLKTYFRGVDNPPSRSSCLQPCAYLSGHVLIEEKVKSWRVLNPW